jgi:hypothetical protein
MYKAKLWQSRGKDKAHGTCSVAEQEMPKINRFVRICHLMYFLVIYCKFMLAFLVRDVLL